MRSRKYNVRIENIPYVEKESDSQLLEKVITECAKVGIQLKDGDVARCHRSSKPKEMRDGTLKAQTIIKLSNWPARKLFQGAGKTAREKGVRFQSSNDLTLRRYELLKYARDIVNDEMARKFAVQEREEGVPDKHNAFVFSTPDGQLLFRVNSRIHAFDSEDKFDELFNFHFDTNRPESYGPRPADESRSRDSHRGGRGRGRGHIYNTRLRSSREEHPRTRTNSQSSFGSNSSTSTITSSR